MFLVKFPMFHVEQFEMKLIFSFLASFLLVSCSKPDPHPELKDPVYTHLESTKTSISQAIEAEDKTLAENKTTLDQVVPQTGQIKYATKRFFESQARLAKLKQELKYIELKISARKKYAQKSYIAAFKEGKPWPDPAEWESFQKELKARETSRGWDSRERIRAFSSKQEKKEEAAKPSH